MVRTSTELAVPQVEPYSTDHIWVIIPAYNEAERIERTLAPLLRMFSNVVVVDDGSVDPTRMILESLPVWSLSHVINCGQGAALQTGIDFAYSRGAELFVTFDADGQHCADDIEKLCQLVERDEVDVALGSRFLGRAEGIPLGRWLTLKLAVLFTRLFSQLRVTDTHNGLRAFNRKAAGLIRLRQNRMAHASEFLDEVRRHKLRYGESPVTVRYSVGTLNKGQTSWNSLRILVELLLGRLTR